MICFCSVMPYVNGFEFWHHFNWDPVWISDASTEMWSIKHQHQMQLHAVGIFTQNHTASLATSNTPTATNLDWTYTITSAAWFHKSTHDAAVILLLYIWLILCLHNNTSESVYTQRNSDADCKTDSLARSMHLVSQRQQTKNTFLGIADSQCILERFLAIASSTALSCCSSSSRRDDVMLWRLAAALLDHDADCELPSDALICGSVVICVVTLTACRDTTPSVLGVAVLLDDSLESAKKRTAKVCNSSTYHTTPKCTHKIHSSSPHKFCKKKQKKTAGRCECLFVNCTEWLN